MKPVEPTLAMSHHVNALFPNESAVLRRLLFWTMAPAPLRDWGTMEAAFRYAAGASYFLLRTMPQGGAEHFITRLLPELLQQFDRCTERYQREHQGQVRGHILWPETLKARCTHGQDLSRYMCREVLHRYDTPENQLVKYMVEKLAQCLQTIPDVLRNGTCYFFSQSSKHMALDDEGQLIAERINRMEKQLNLLRRNPRLRSVTLPTHIEGTHLMRAVTARTEHYAQVAALYKKYRAMVLHPLWSELTDSAHSVLLVPGYVGDDAEPWLRLGASLWRSSSQDTQGLDK